MLPTYHEGDILIGLRTDHIKVGDVVVAATSQHPMIKRVKKLESHKMWLEGDNASRSTDSRQVGFYDQGQMEARIIIRLFSAKE